MKQHFNKVLTISASVIGALVIGVSGDQISNLLFGTEDTEKQTVQKSAALEKNSRIDNQVLQRIELMVESIIFTRLNISQNAKEYEYSEKLYRIKESDIYVNIMKISIIIIFIAFIL